MLADATVDSQAVSEVSKELSKLGVTGLHDMTPSNGMQNLIGSDSYKPTGNSVRNSVCRAPSTFTSTHQRTGWKPVV